MPGEAKKKERKKPGEEQHRQVKASPTSKCQARCSKGKPNRQVPGEVQERQRRRAVSLTQQAQQVKLGKEKHSVIHAGLNKLRDPMPNR